MPLVFWLKPVNYLLKAGERERVIEFLEAFARVSGGAGSAAEGRRRHPFRTHAHVLSAHGRHGRISGAEVARQPREDQELLIS
jgi:hypothetical protein